MSTVPRRRSASGVLAHAVLSKQAKPPGRRRTPREIESNAPPACADVCQAAKTSRSNASITEHTIYNKNDAAFVMIEFGTAGLRVFDLRNGDKPKEAAYYNDGKGHVHSGVFHYDDARGIMIASGRLAAHVLMLEPEAIEALGLPKPTDEKYPYK